MRRRITATIITIGDELLIGQVIDTNSAFIAQQLNKEGILVEKRIAISDNASEIMKALDDNIGRVNIILLTGGLGPTSDDITKPTLAKYFKSKLVINEAALNHVKYLSKEVYKRPLTTVHINQAKVPSNCEVLINKRGSAPCMIFEKDHTYIASMAGVPYEMEGIVLDLLPKLKLHFQLPKVIHQTVVTSGIGESDMAAILRDFEKKLPKATRLAYLPGLGVLRLRLSSVAFSKEEESIAKKQFSSLKKLSKNYIVAAEDTPPEILLGKLLRKSGASMSTAESCTGGRIASLITSIAGASAYYMGSVISYSNTVKEKQLAVKKSTLKNYGAVSEQVVIEMLQGLLKRMNTTYGIAVSGIMGPGGGTPEKPVGTVWLAVGTAKKVVTKKIKFRFDRRRNIEGTSIQALYLLRKFIEGEDLSD